MKRMSFSHIYQNRAVQCLKHKHMRIFVANVSYSITCFDWSERRYRLTFSLCWQRKMFPYFFKFFFVVSSVPWPNFHFSYYNESVSRSFSKRGRSWGTKILKISMTEGNDTWFFLRKSEKAETCLRGYYRFLTL